MLAETKIQNTEKFQINQVYCTYNHGFYAY
jgi:hypothetical protein